MMYVVSKPSRVSCKKFKCALFHDDIRANNNINVYDVGTQAYIKYLITLTYQDNLHKSEENVMTFILIVSHREYFLKIIKFYSNFWC